MRSDDMETVDPPADLVVEEPFDPQAPVDEPAAAAALDPPDYFKAGAEQGYVGDKPTG